MHWAGSRMGRTTIFSLAGRDLPESSGKSILNLNRSDASCESVAHRSYCLDIRASSPHPPSLSPRKLSWGTSLRNLFNSFQRTLSLCYPSHLFFSRGVDGCCNAARLGLGRPLRPSACRDHFELKRKIQTTNKTHARVTMPAGDTPRSPGWTRSNHVGIRSSLCDR